MRYLLSITLALALSVAAFAGETFTVIRVIDGDTIRVWDASGQTPTIRLIGIDTPETRLDEKAVRTARQWDVPVAEVIYAGEVARSYVTSLIPPGSVIRVEADSRSYDDYDRILAYVYTPTGQCLNEVLMRQGYAQVFRRDPFRERRRYLELEATARRENRVFWKTIWKNVKE